MIFFYQLTNVFDDNDFNENNRRIDEIHEIAA